MNRIIIAIIGALVVVGGIYAYSTSQKESTTAEQKMVEEEKMMQEKKDVEEKEMMENEDSIKIDAENMMPEGETSLLNKDEGAIMENEEVMAKAGSYEAYSGDKIAMAATGDVVIFFHASWCPSCRGLNSDIEKNLSAIPAGVTILKADYDKETELKKKYGVTTQHTLVQVDKDGSLIKKWSGGSKLENLLSQIQ